MLHIHSLRSSEKFLPERNFRDEENLKNYLKKLNAGDTIIFDSVSRMSRDAEEGFTMYEDLFSKGINLVFLKEPHINTETYKSALQGGIPTTGTDIDCILEGINKYLLLLAKEQIRLAFEQSEKEVQDLRQRIKEGMQTARLSGKQIGQASGYKACNEEIYSSKRNHPEA